MDLASPGFIGVRSAYSPALFPTDGDLANATFCQERKTQYGKEGRDARTSNDLGPLEVLVWVDIAG